MLLSLNELYEKNLIWYWTNACGDINVLGASPLFVGQYDDLLTAQRELLAKYFTEDGVKRYVVTCSARPAIGLGLLFDRLHLASMMDKDNDSPKVDCGMKVYIRCITSYAESVQNKFPFCDIAIGYETDPDGHELLVLVPYDQREKIAEVAEYLNETAYTYTDDLVDEELRKEQEKTKNSRADILREAVDFLLQKRLLTEESKATEQIRALAYRDGEYKTPSMGDDALAKVLRRCAQELLKLADYETADKYADALNNEADLIEDLPICVVQDGVLEGVYSPRTKKEIPYLLLDYDNFGLADEETEEFHEYQRLEKLLGRK